MMPLYLVEQNQAGSLELKRAAVLPGRRDPEGSGKIKVSTLLNRESIGRPRMHSCESETYEHGLQGTTVLHHRFL